jgi:hypothetical protein
MRKPWPAAQALHGMRRSYQVLVSTVCKVWITELHYETTEDGLLVNRAVSPAVPSSRERMETLGSRRLSGGRFGHCRHIPEKPTFVVKRC